jgi:hypothetical protein
VRAATKRRSDKSKLVREFNVTGNVDDVILPPDEDIRSTTVQPIIRENKDTGVRDLITRRTSVIN